jgi:hypothetical protein
MLLFLPEGVKFLSSHGRRLMGKSLFDKGFNSFHEGGDLRD